MRCKRGRWRAAALVAALVLVAAACGDDDDTASDDTADTTATTAPSSETTATTTGDTTATTGDTTATTSAGDDSGIPVLEVTATDDGSGGYAFELPASVPAGLTRIHVTNTGTEAHHAQLFKLNEGSTVDDLVAGLQSAGPAGALATGIFDGGTGVVVPGAESQADALVDLQPGQYVFMCFVETAEHEAHVALGMLQPFEVTASDATTEAPEAAAHVPLIDYGIEVPAEIAGDAVLHVQNTAEAEAHEMNIMKLSDGVDFETALDALTSDEPAPADAPPPATPVGGMQALLPGASQLLQLDLEPGDYMVVCFIPSIADEVPHIAKGMAAPLTVT